MTVWTSLGAETIEASTLSASDEGRMTVRRLHRRGTPGSRLTRGRRSWARWVVPSCALVAVGIVIALTASISDDQSAGYRAQVYGTMAGEGPRYLLTTELPERVGAAQRVAVREVATGRIIQTVRLPAGVKEFTDVAAAGDDRTFFLTGAVRGRTWQIFRLRLDGNGRAAGPEPVRHGQVRDPAGLAVTPDGSGLVFGVSHMEVSGKYGETPGEIDLLDLATGRRRAWKTNVWGQLKDVSSSVDGTRLAFSWSTAYGGRGNGIRVLDTSVAGELLWAARLIVPSEGAFQQAHHPLLGPDGTTLSMVVVQRDGRALWSRLIEVTTATGRQTRVLYQEPYLGDPAQSGYAFNAICRSGRYVLIVNGRRTLQIDTASGRAVRLPYPDADPDRVAC